MWSGSLYVSITLTAMLEGASASAGDKQILSQSVQLVDINVMSFRFGETLQGQLFDEM